MVQVKAIKKTINSNVVEKMLQHFETHKFIKKLDTKGIQFGFLLEHIKESVRKEWIQSNVIASDFPAFLFTKNTEENFKTNWEDVRNLVSTDSFNIVEVFPSANKDEETPAAANNPEEIVSNQFKTESGTMLWNHCFCTSENAAEIFHKKQRERKNWWRKFSALPGRFKVTNLNNKNGDKSLVCEVKAEFPWGIETVETIKYLQNCSATKYHFLEKLHSNKKKKLPQIVLSEAILENITFAFLCDSYEKLNEQSDRDVLMLDRRLAPYKVAVAGSGSTSDATKSLEELCLLMVKKIRKLGISVLFLPDACTAAIQKQVIRNDALGVPYTLLFNDKTLRDGIVSLRSRDTTLQESSHVSLIPEYLEKILR